LTDEKISSHPTPLFSGSSRIDELRSSDQTIGRTHDVQNILWPDGRMVLISVTLFHGTALADSLVDAAGRGDVPAVAHFWVSAPA
jgi:hypothetical protein